MKNTLPQNFYKEAVGAEKIILFLFDGLGDNLLQNEALKHDFFQGLVKKGFYSPITSVFPSTTAAAISTINSGLSPLEHGLPEWNVYFRELDIVLQTLPFMPVVPSDMKKLANPPAGLLFNQETIYQRLQRVKIPSFTFLYEGYMNSPYNQTACIGSTVITYKTLSDLLTSLLDCLRKVSKGFFYVYWGAVDASEHTFGPSSKEAKFEVSKLANSLQKDFVDKVEFKDAADTALLITADHGQVPVDPQTTIYLDKMKGLEDLLRVSPNGYLIPPSGGPRDAFLHIKEGKTEYAQKMLQKELGQKAKVLTSQQVSEIGFFGSGTVHSEFKSRTGDILILPCGNQTIWYHFTPEINFELNGHHGGLSKEEMMIPFLCARLSKLKKI